MKYYRQVQCYSDTKLVNLFRGSSEFLSGCHRSGLSWFNWWVSRLMHL